MLGVLLRAIYNHIINIVQLLLSGGSIQVLGFRVGLRQNAREPRREGLFQGALLGDLRDLAMIGRV